MAMAVLKSIAVCLQPNAADEEFFSASLWPLHISISTSPAPLYS